MAGFTMEEQVAPPAGDVDPNAQDVDTAAPGALSPAAVPANPEGPDATTQRGVNARRTSLRVLHAASGGPFAMPRREYDGEDDVDMEDVSGDTTRSRSEQDRAISSELGKRVQTMPTLPKPPTFRGSTALEKQRFMKDYEAYCRQLSALETAFFRPFRMPVGACVEDERRRLIAMFDICKSLDDITEKDWIDYFWEGRIVGELDFDKVKALMKEKLRMDVSLTDADSRVSKLAHEMYQVLEQANMEWMVKGEPKKIVNYLIDTLSPEEFRRTIKNEMAREANKPLYKDVVAFIKWLRASCKEYLRWEPANAKKPQPAPLGGKHGDSKKPAVKRDSARPNTSGVPGASGKRTCLKCHSTAHRVKDCPQAKPGEAETLLREWRERRTVAQTATRTAPPVQGVKALQLPDGSKDTGSTCQVMIEDVLELDRVLLDSGADVNIASRSLVAHLERNGVSVRVETCTPRSLSMFDGKTLTVMQKAWFDTIKIYSSAGPLLLRRTPAWIFGDDAEPLTMMLSRPVMERLGYSVDAILAKAYGTRPEWDLQDLATEEGAVKALQEDSRGQQGIDERLRTATPEAGPLEADEMVTRLLEERVQEAADAGLAEPLVTQLRELLVEYRDVFRVSFGQDPPIRVEPLRVRVREGATPVRISARRYPPAHMQYLDQHVDELLASGLAYTNPSSRWASPPRIVAKQEPGTYRMTVDTRAVNERTDPIQWPMPVLESALGLLEKSTCYFTLDWFRGYWQLPLHHDSQEMFSIMTHRGIITPTRVLMGGTDAVAYCQHVVEEVFRPLLYQGVLAWLDDILGYALDPVNMLEVLERVLAACKSFGLKLHPGKCHFYQQEARWCGKIVSKEGIRHCPSRIQGLVAMPDPINAGQLQQFTCAVNWMRQNIPQYTQMVSPLLAVIDAAAKIAGGRKTKQLSRVHLAAVGWNQEHVDALTAIRQALCDMVPLAHPDASKEVCLYCDASQDFWGAICTGVDQSDLSKPLSQQNHTPLAFLSGKFTPAQSRWPTIEKEAFAIVESAKRLEYLLLRPGGFHLFTDHRNLVYMFDPFATDTAMQRYRADKLQRWAMTMTSYKYVIEHIRGEDNTWADMLSRWGCASQPPDSRGLSIQQLAVVRPISPLEDDAFQWPDMDEIRGVQEEEPSRPSGVIWSRERECYETEGGLVWIPSTASDLIQRLCVVGHAGGSGHRGKKTTTSALSAWCWWASLPEDVGAFVDNCIHCIATKNGREPRPYGPALHATKPNEVIHFDFLSLPADEDTQKKYVLVVKDDFSGFVELHPTLTADAPACASALLGWFKRFGVVKQWVSDQGPHFRNEVMKILARTLGSQHHFTTAYCPWANGTVEVVNRLLLKCLRAVLSERRLPPSKWEQVLGLVQSALNQQPSDRLGGRAPLTAFTGLPPTTPLAVVFSDDHVVEMSAEVLQRSQEQHLTRMAEALEAMHRDVAETSDRRRMQARARRASKSKPPNFSVGDFVLVAMVTQHANKLAINWQGPKRIVRAISDWVFEVESLNPPQVTTTHHVSRLRFYAEASRGVTEDLLQYALHSQGGHLVEAFRGVRFNEAARRWEVEVKWLGLEAIENTWEPYSALQADVPVLLDRYCAAHADEPDVNAMVSAQSHRRRRNTRRRR